MDVQHVSEPRRIRRRRQRGRTRRGGQQGSGAHWRRRRRRGLRAKPRRRRWRRRQRQTARIDRDRRHQRRRSLNTNISVGGFGGSGNVGGIVDVTNRGDLFTSGDISNGVRAQSIGGGGGVGGSARGANLALGATMQKGEDPGELSYQLAQVGGTAATATTAAPSPSATPRPSRRWCPLARDLRAEHRRRRRHRRRRSRRHGFDKVDGGLKVLEFVGRLHRTYREEQAREGEGASSIRFANGRSASAAIRAPRATRRS